MDHELYVLKRIPVDAASPSEADAAVREAHVLSLLRHPHVVPYKVSSCSCKDVPLLSPRTNSGTSHPSLLGSSLHLRRNFSSLTVTCASSWRTARVGTCLPTPKRSGGCCRHPEVRLAWKAAA